MQISNGEKFSFEGVKINKPAFGTGKDGLDFVWNIDYYLQHVRQINLTIEAREYGYVVRVNAKLRADLIGNVFNDKIK